MGQLYALQGLGHIALQQNELEASINNFQQALKLAETLDSLQEVHDCCLNLADAYHMMGNDEKALTYFKRYHNAFATMNDFEKQRSLQNIEVKHRTEIAQLMTEKLAKDNENLKQAYLEQDELLKIVAHDLKNPLHAVSIQLQVAAKQIQNGRVLNVEQHLKKARESASFMSEILGRLAVIARYDDEGQHIDLQPVPLMPILAATVERNRPQALRKQIKLSYEHPQAVQVQADPQLLGQAFDNLLANGVKYSFRNSTIKIVVEGKEKRVQIHIIDDGVGIAPHEFNRLFKKYGRLPSSRPTDNEKSVGIGLYMTKKQIEAMNGQISATSPGLGQGSIFTVELERTVSNLEGELLEA